MWRYGLNLSCPHETRVELGTTEDFNVAWDMTHSLPLLKNGYWPRAHRCDGCRRLRRVKSLFMEMT